MTLTAADNLDTNPTIYYSLNNGSTWINNGKNVTLTLNQGLTNLMYYAKDAAGNICTTQTRNYTIDTTAPTVTVNFENETVNSTQVILTATDNLDPKPTIYYTLNGTNPTTSSTKYTSPISIDISTTLKFIAVDNAGNTGTIRTINYIPDTIAPTATASLQGGTYSTYQNIILTATDNLDTNPVIYYTLDGSTPTTSSDIYMDPINIVNNFTTLSFMAVDYTGNQGQVQTVNYTIDLPIINLVTSKVYSSIQDAIDDASTNDTIQINDGTYIENIVIDNPIDIVAAGDNVTIQPLDPSQPVITINSGGSGSSIQGLNINGATSSNGIYINLADNCTITGNNITNNSIGIDIDSSNNSTITENNIINNLNTGIYLSDSSANINFNRIVGNDEYGIDNEGNGTVDATNNWWGSNVDPTTDSSNICNNGGTVTYNPWLVLSIYNSGTIVAHDSYTSDIVADLTQNNLGNDTSSIGNVLDGIAIIFNTTVGTINATTSTIDGEASATLNSSATLGLSNVSATLDNQTVFTIPKVFTSVQAAIDDASTYDGDTIEIEDGTYTENIVLNKQLTLTPVNAGNVTIQPLDPSKPIITINSGGNGSLIQDLIINGATSSYGIYINSTNNCSIIDNNLTNNNKGIYLDNSLNSTVSGNIISNNVEGVYLSDSMNNSISGNIISNNTNDGININRSYNNAVYDNSISNNTLCGINIFDYSGYVNSINFNRIVGNGNYGLYVEEGLVNATNNWWGSNNPIVSLSGPSDIAIEDGIVNYDPWLVLSVTSSCDRSNRTGTTYNYIITADLTHNNHGEDTSPTPLDDDNPYDPYEIPLYFNTTLGTINTTTITLRGKTAATLNSTTPGAANVTTTLDNQQISMLVNVTSINDLGIYNTRTNQGFETIQAAIDDVNTQNGDTITLADGTYTENIFINKTITLTSVSGAHVILKPIDKSEPVIKINSGGNGSTISGLTITTSSYGIYMDSVSNCNITGNNILDTFNGIYLTNSTNNSIIGNTITNTGVGINYLNSDNTITENNITCSQIEDIQVMDTTGIVMSDTTSNCGPASLATILQNLGINVSQDVLAAIAGTDDDGTTMYGLVQAAQQQGVIAKGLKLTVNELKPGNIVYLNINGTGHYSIITSITDTTVYLADTDLGNTNMTMDNFTADYIQNTTMGYGYILVVTNNSTNPQLNNTDTLTDDEMKSIKGTKTAYQWWCISEWNAGVLNPHIQKIASWIWRNSGHDLNSLGFTIFAWVNNHITWVDHSNTQESIEDLLNSGRGNCVEQARLCVCLAHALGVPARYVIKAPGYYIDYHNGRVPFEGHVWAQIKITTWRYATDLDPAWSGAYYGFFFDHITWRERSYSWEITF